jgi:hypothetical protein
MSNARAHKARKTAAKQPLPRAAAAASLIEKALEQPAAEAFWNERFEQLRAFRQQQGHCRVPALLNGSPLLSDWVARQRKL